MPEQTPDPLEGNAWADSLNIMEQGETAGVFALMAIAYEIGRVRQSFDGLRATLSQIKADAEAHRRTHR